MATYPKRLIEVDLPIKRISAHARREKSIRHGHISTLHIWWARRPLAACRAVLCATLWPDPADGDCPQTFRERAAEVLCNFAEEVRTDQKLAGLCKDSWTRWQRTTPATMSATSPTSWGDMRYALLDFIADFANWDASAIPAFLEAARALTHAAHEALGGVPGTRPLVVDPFAGGGSIPLEALRIGADAYASDLNPVAVLLNKVVLEYIPKYGDAELRMVNVDGEPITFHGLAEAVRYWGSWIKEQAEQELREYYPEEEGVAPVAYLWARTIQCEGPGCGAEVPLMRSLWLAKKGRRSVALRLRPNLQAKRVDFSIIKSPTTKDVGDGTVRRGSATCPCCGYTTPVEAVRRQLKARRGGAADARLFCVVTTRQGEQGRHYRLPNVRDTAAARRAAEELVRRMADQQGHLSLVPNESISLNEIRRISVPLYGMSTWGDLFSPRQALALTTLARLTQELGESLAKRTEGGLASAVQTLLALVLDRQADLANSLCAWEPIAQCPRHLFSRQAIPIVYDFAEGGPLGASSGSFQVLLDSAAHALDAIGSDWGIGRAESASAPRSRLPNDSVPCLFTDPPYYDAVPYAYLSDFFYVWLRRTLLSCHTDILGTPEVPKTEEIVVDRPHELSTSTKGMAFYERELTLAFAEGLRITRDDGISTIVFASKTTASWEAILNAIVDANWTITGSWPIDTEMAARIAAQGQARLGSSVHLVCRPRQHHAVGDWRDVLTELPERMHAWLPRLVREGVVGADAIFACLGPALEIYSRYERVEKASGEIVTLHEYLEQVWGAVAREALQAIFSGTETHGLEEDARLTAIWFWTLKEAANGNGAPREPASAAEDDPSDEAEEEVPSGKRKPTGYALEYDAARKLAQGLGADLQRLSRPGGIVTIQGSTAALNSVTSRARFLIAEQLALSGEPEVQRSRSERPGRATMRSVDARQASLFSDSSETQRDPERPMLAGLEPPSDLRSLLAKLVDSGHTTLDRLHQAMLLFGRGRSALMGPFLQATQMAGDTRFWQLAQALSALYPPQSDEKRWVDGLLARKKSMDL